MGIGYTIKAYATTHLTSVREVAVLGLDQDTE
jgi:hypothetical protein